ncbi:hypothetical protein SESBI_06699 [Sesbania bispinosa]|nr:hypothetical protein SESBI_06699 [Sesbania bispinosa]
MWEKHPECAQTIEDDWQANTKEEDVWETFLKKAKSRKRTLKIWHQTFKRVDTKIIALKKELEELQNRNPGDTH